MVKKWISLICACIISLIMLLTPLAVRAQNNSTDETIQENSSQQPETADLIQAPSGILMEAQTGTVIYQKNQDTRRSPASITKIMTLILIFDALEKGNLKMDDVVTTSAHARSMGGSQVFLEEGETQTVETLIKCIVIASGNDASVAMAEHICGSEQEFVRHMNERAAELGMENTNFEDCCGLTESTNHYTTARDIAIMSRELITKYPKILEYSSIWMENITHVTRQGSSEFGLTNTNKLIRSYEGCVGLKTGSTSIAKYCLSAVAKRNGITLIAVVMAAPDYKVRFKDAASMLNYGFSKCSLYIDKKMQALPEVPVRKGKEKTVPLTYQKQFQYLSTDGQNISDVKRKLRIHREVDAPIKKGSKAGEMIYSAGDRELGRVDILYDKTVPKATYMDALKTVLENL
ncbi:MAG: D-alanyl-D-alanine carboxypeptidase [Blautia sp.]|uniref:D-alanyl-D-alanine carboxypeptidase family protein n=1 Tax=Blautia sp. TaxID=1955243 RepID=UPI0025C2D307|nr:D-alanyl-D-alanine carboxypeptidase family protein [Blautia sp.]MCI6301590.1 D-alanyl-D-alanine carboxypeptidase [Blautia sp.]MDD6413468.1 D-alanyl-D-alanine carboxypeptidase [Blautia sp.]MDY4116329.1 D-alanyl-D-alanine carboxypeptidase family protein [Blautia sp.]